MKKNTLILLALLLAVIGAYFILKKDNNSTVRKDLVDFGILNTDEIDKIRITKKDAKGAVVLERKGEGYWMLNDTWEANIKNIELTLKTLRKMEVKSPVAEGGKPLTLFWQKAAFSCF